MPGYDKTDPARAGAMSGRGMGRCAEAGSGGGCGRGAEKRSCIRRCRPDFENEREFLKKTGKAFRRGSPAAEAAANCRPRITVAAKKRWDVAPPFFVLTIDTHTVITVLLLGRC